MAFPARDSWLHFATDTWTIKQYAGFTGRLSIAVPLTIGTTSLSQVAAGAYDAYFTNFAKNLAALGRGNADLRLGWEFNGNWQPWSAYNPTTFVAAFRHVAKGLKQLLPSATIDWNGNWGGSQCGHDPFTELYPGDDVVDVIGVDTYDGGWVPALTSTQFASWRTSKYGLQAWLDFAKARGKKLAVPEWGLVSGQEGDNVAFVDGMYAFFQANAASLAFESYFNHGSRALYDPVSMPKASAEYRALW
jgi:beta-mannanase